MIIDLSTRCKRKNRSESLHNVALHSMNIMEHFIMNGNFREKFEQKELLFSILKKDIIIISFMIRTHSLSQKS